VGKSSAHYLFWQAQPIGAAQLTAAVSDFGTGIAATAQQLINSS
jgi:hypothetical protein